ncbi:MAG: hypothetical protein IKX40_04215 [Thermoguttaceae bacterium]|nr:hypothetical protein [Thermoguttaceae bacterium]
MKSAGETSRKVRKEMKGGNEANEVSGITHSPKANRNVEKCAYQTDEAENLLWM